MRPNARRSVVLVVVVSLVSSIAAGVASRAIGGDSIGIDGVLAGKIKHDDTLHAELDYLSALGVRRVEDLSDKQLLATIKLPQGRRWEVRLGELCREEAGRRGLTKDKFPAQAPPVAPRAPIKLSAADLEVLARIVKGETWHDTPDEGRVAVASVVLNRLVRKGWPKTVAGVAHQPYQFSCYNADARHMLYDGPIPGYAWKAAREAAAGSDPVPGAVQYYNPYLVRPYWARSLRLVKRIGTSPLNTHEFYR